MAFLPTDPKKQRLVLLGVLPLLAVVAYWYFIQQGQSKALSDAQTRLEELETKNAAAKALAAQGGPELKRKLALYEAHVARLEELIPRSEEVPDLLHDITMQATESGVELNLMRPEKGVPTDFYVRQVYSMSVVGPYEGVGRFLTAVGSLPRIVTPIKVKLIPRIDYDKSGALNLQAEFQIQTYVAPEPGAGPAKGKPSNAHA